MDDFSCLSHSVKLFTSRDDFSGAAMTNAAVPSALRQVTSGEVRIGRHVVIGAGSVIMPGITIGEGCAVGALSYVDRSLYPWGIYAGVPAKRSRTASKTCSRSRKSSPPAAKSFSGRITKAGVFSGAGSGRWAWRTGSCFDELGDEKERPLLRLHVDAANVLADDAKRGELGGRDANQ